MPALCLRTEDGADATILLYGAQLISWKPRCGGERIYLSENASFSEGNAVRGGVPLIFPQFGKLGNLPRHGFARNRNWEQVDVRSSQHNVGATLRLSDSEATREIWSHSFTAELNIAISADRLCIEFSVENTGITTFSFTGGLHTYLRLNAIEYARVSGLEGHLFFDNVLGFERLDHDERLQVRGEMDRIYYDIKHPLWLCDQHRVLEIRNCNLPDVVIWNPGASGSAQIVDMPDDGFREMLCVEAVVFQNAVELAPKQRWSGQQMFDAASGLESQA